MIKNMFNKIKKYWKDKMALKGLLRRFLRGKKFFIEPDFNSNGALLENGKHR